MPLATSSFQVSTAIIGNASLQELKRSDTSRSMHGSASELGGRIILGTATSVDVVVTDANGKVLFTQTGISSSTDIDPDVIGVLGPLYVTTTNISNSAHTLTVVWTLKK